MSTAQLTITVTYPDGMSQVEISRYLRRVEHCARSTPRPPLGVKVQTASPTNQEQRTT